MQLTALVALAFAAVASCDVAAASTASGCPVGHEWRAPAPGDRRSPCPLLNSLANHGFLARNGKNISINDLVNGLEDAINLSPNSSLPVAQLAATTSTTGNKNTLNLDDLNKHDIIEHDGSLSRNDIYFGDNHSFNPKIFDTVAAYFTSSTISIETAAKARAARVAAARKVNPTFNFTASQNQFSMFESALYLRTFGSAGKGNANTKFVQVMFREERLPYQEGYRRPAAPLLNDEIVDLASKVGAAAPVATAAH